MLDRENFDMKEKVYQEELASHRQRIRQEVESEYAQKEYVGNKDMAKAAREKDAKDQERIMKERMAEIENTLDHLHFPERGRQVELDLLLKKENRIRAANERFADNGRKPNDGREP